MLFALMARVVRGVVLLTVMSLVVSCGKKQAKPAPVIPLALAGNRAELSGEWKLTCTERDISIPATLPGDVYGAMISAGKIPDPYWRRNESGVKWLGEVTWAYSKSFVVPEELLAYESVYLNAEMVDTVATFELNGTVLGAVDNMFQRHRFDVRSLLREGENTLSIVFDSAVKAAAERGKAAGYPVPNIQHNRFRYMNFLRKPQCHTGWDWGPCLPVAGVYGDLSLCGATAARIEHVYATQEHTEGHCDVTVTAELIARRATVQDVVFKFDGRRRKVTADLVAGVNQVKAAFSLRNPRLWWPVGYGEQPLYELMVSSGEQSVNKRLGLRRMEIINVEDPPDPALKEPKPLPGKSMTVRVNGADVFCKGANWIPPDALPSRQTPELYRQLIGDAVDANMNMLRVWGGGKYERELFYSLCDELGVLVWQDMMFACSMYPATDAFIADCCTEVEYQIKRLRDHPCIALWCGDNEVIGALKWYTETKRERDLYLVAYDRLNRAIGKVAAEADPTRMFWPSSPSDGPGEFRDGWRNFERGDSHYWDVWHGGKPFEAFTSVRPRFCSEFGYQSFPSLETVQTFAEEGDLNVSSPVLEHHQRNPGGNGRIVSMFMRYFRMPSGFDQFLYLSQVQQALAIKTAVEYWRSLKPYCMGTLYWQLNDNWPVASWSSIEYGGKWKQLHYQARRFYAPVMAAVIQRPVERMDGEKKVKVMEVHIRAISDVPEPCRAQIRMTLWDLNGKALREERYNVSIPANGVADVLTIPVKNLAPKADQVFLTTDLEAKTPTGYMRHRNTHFFVPFKRCELADARVRVSDVREGRDGSIDVRVRTDRPAFFVVLDVPGIAGTFSDNSFTILPEDDLQLTFTPRSSTGADAVREAILVTHLRKSY
ncbi:MAG: glycoside hydrolase family 2 protein [Lentisphaerae bacterium]|jgi:beta-mannosidase|nr:glycoside hydrolase family 2 protein [Lentisphaerota bacterium]MBT4821528.1 glycoside hydrolase family 2 protein [Lentisphaerota bacterium]MBT5606954.1 glycoside hydrolase family 2 protein [Lentisphaerota bacterium]MBT7055107.1 glycoside hydrolase family 2 protein [Lentisphaerota bacterium]MBT7842221.1 glycoside hydrolase family 2 protein [Lentisphaerota bacterium]